MVNIQPVTIWKDGTSKQASVLVMRSIFDDLATSANFYYELKEADSQDAEGNTVSGSVLSVGNVSMSGDDYSDWSGDNAEAYAFAASQLNLTIV